jgi:hypothetical protein
MLHTDLDNPLDDLPAKYESLEKYLDKVEEQARKSPFGVMYKQARILENAAQHLCKIIMSRKAAGKDKITKRNYDSIVEHLADASLALKVFEQVFFKGLNITQVSKGAKNG